MLELWCREVLDTGGRASVERIARAPNVDATDVALLPAFDRGGAS